MRRTIKLGNNEVEYELRRSRKARAIRITVAVDGGVVVVIPRLATERMAEAFLAKKSSWVLRTLARFRDLPPVVSFPGSFAADKARAMALAETKVAEWNKHYRLPVRSIRIKDHKTRWGSASRAGNVNFNYRIVYLPDHLVDYLVVHEICHLRHMDHSPRFWRSVGETIPDHRRVRKELLRYARFGA